MLAIHRQDEDTILLNDDGPKANLGPSDHMPEGNGLQVGKWHAVKAHHPELEHGGSGHQLTLERAGWVYGHESSSVEHDVSFQLKQWISEIAIPSLLLYLSERK